MRRNYFDQSALQWDQDSSKVERAHILANEISSLISDCSYQTALEFGCGTGLLSFCLKDHFSPIHLVDNSEGMIEVLNTKIEQQRLTHFISHHKDIKDIKNLQVDVIYTNLTLHHITDIQPILHVLHQLLTPNGMLIISDLVKEDGSFHAQNNEPVPHNGFNQTQLNQWLQESAFTPTYYKEYHTLTKGEKTFPLFIQTALKKVK